MPETNGKGWNESMKKRLGTLILVLALVLGLTPMVASADESTPLSGFCGAEGNGENVTWKLELNGETVESGSNERAAYTLTISGTGAMADYEAQQGRTTSPWTSHQKDISKVIVEEGVTAIGDCAFWLFQYMTNATIPDSVTSIGYRAFYNCESLKDITFPANLKEIEEGAFGNCKNFRAIVLPEGVESIGIRAFAACNHVEKIVLPSTITTIGFAAFGNCSGVTTILIPDSITTIGACAFYKTSSNVNDTIYIYETNSTAKTTMTQLQTAASGLTDTLGDYNGRYPYSSTYTSLAYVPAGTTLSSGGKLMLENYIIEGYYEDENCSDTKVAAPVPGTTYYTKWVVCPHTNYDSGTVTTPATCTEPGVMTYICQDCGAKKTEPIAPLGHHFSGTATSDGNGKHTIACINPGCTEVSEPMDCDTRGADGSCSVCGYKRAVTPVVPASPVTPAITPTIQDTTGGTVTVEPPSAKPGTEVIITVIPDPGYQLEDLTVTDKNGNRIELVDNGDGTYSYRQPGGAVTIEAMFVKLPCDGGTNCPSKKFRDLDTSLWYHPEIDCVLELGLMNGVSEDIFDPNGYMSRYMLMTVLARLDGVNTADSSPWYEKGMTWAVENGVSDGNNGNNNVTRQEIVTMLYRYAKLKGMDVSRQADLDSFADSEQVADWAKDAMRWAVCANIMRGKDGNRIDPHGAAARVEVAAMVARFLEWRN